MIPGNSISFYILTRRNGGVTIGASARGVKRIGSGGSHLAKYDYYQIIQQMLPRTSREIKMPYGVWLGYSKHAGFVFEIFDPLANKTTPMLMRCIVDPFGQNPFPQGCVRSKSKPLN